MRNLIRLLVLAAWLGVGAPPLVATVPPKPDLLIMIVTIGFRSDYLTHGKTPVLAALADHGVSAAMHPSYPPETPSNQYTLLTGLRPDHHGIVDLNMEDPVLGRFNLMDSTNSRWWDAAEPIWATAERQGLKAGLVSWIGPQSIRGVTPTYSKPFDRKVLADERVNQALAWLDLPESQRPNFVLIPFDIVDTAGHHHGPASSELDAALASTDASIGRLVDGLKARGLYDHVNVIVVADHGMASTSPGRVIYIDDVAGGADAIHVVSMGANVGLSITPQAPKNTLKRLLAARDHMRCWKKAALPKRLHYGTNPRIPPVICLPDVGWEVFTHERMATIKDFNAADHGFNPDAPEMATVFIAEGPAFKDGKTLPTFDNIDVQPLVAKLLHLEVPKSDGTTAVFDGVLSSR